MARSVVFFLLLGLAHVRAGADAPAEPGYRDHPRVPELLTRLRDSHGFAPADLDGVRAALGEARRVPALIESEQQAKEKTLTWDAYRRIHVHDRNVANGARFLEEQAAWLARAEAEYGVPPTVIAAILGVETKYGAYTGPHRVLDALATQGFEHPTRSTFFFGELVEFFALCRDLKLQPLAVRGSYAGAIGAAQFMPSNYRRLALDFDGDGRRDLWHLPDAIGSIANYLVRYAPDRAWQRGLPAAVPAELDGEPGEDWPLNGRAVTHRVGDFRRAGVRPQVALPPDLPVGLLELTLAEGKEYWLGLHNFYSIMSYNPRVYYAMAVAQLAQALEGPEHDLVSRR